MPAQNYFTSTGIETYTNPLASGSDGKLIHSVNMISFPYGGKSKRPGYSAFLGTPDNAQVNSLFSFSNIGGTATNLNLYRASGSSVYYSLQGTGAWTLAGNGTITNGSHFGHAIGNGGTVLIGGDGVGSTRHSTDGVSFTNTTLAPVAPYFAEYHGRVYAAGTNSTIFYSTSNDATNWNLSGTSDSSSFRIPADGKLSQPFKAGDRLIIPKTRGEMFNWDDYQLIDMSTKYGPSSPYGITDTEDYRFWVNQYGHFGFDGANSQLLSNAVQRYFYNRQNTGIAGTAFSTIPAVTHFYDYFASIGTVTDDFTQRQISNAILNYNYQKNEYLMWQFANNPTAYHSYFDVNGKRQLIFGDASGQCYQLDPTVASDNGSAINTELVYLFSYSSVSPGISAQSAAAYDKKWNYIRLFFNPGCEVKIQAAFANTFTYQHLQWFDIVDSRPNPNNNTSDGVVEFRFPQGSRSKLLFVRIYEASLNSQWTYYGCSIDAEPVLIQ